jgi:hypothetical protein
MMQRTVGITKEVTGGRPSDRKFVTAICVTATTTMGATTPLKVPTCNTLPTRLYKVTYLNRSFR